ncbi:MAG: 30S ribosomal protein S13 [Candidatus Woesearchaeota archaeon]
MDKDFKYIVRIASTDLDGHKAILYGLQKIKGIGIMYANMICYLANVDKTKKTGMLSPAEEERLSDAIVNYRKYNIPAWMLNRRRDYETGEDLHLSGPELSFNVENDIKRMKKIKCFKGFRHHWGQPVRGQRTRSNFRKNKGKRGKGSLGVQKAKASKKGK